MTQAQSMYIPPASQCCTTHGIRVLEILCTGSYASKRHVGLNIVRASRHAVFFFDQGDIIVDCDIHMHDPRHLNSDMTVAVTMMG